MLFKNRKGTSLIEAAISIALIGIMLLWAAKIYSNSLKNTATTSDMEIATQIASDRIENLKKLNKSEINNKLKNPPPLPEIYNKYYDYKYIYPKKNNGKPKWTNKQDVSIINIEVDVYKKGKTVPLIKIECNFLRKSDDGSNIGT
jgi:Tfp pilus assembly protein PilV